MAMEILLAETDSCVIFAVISVTKDYKENNRAVPRNRGTSTKNYLGESGYGYGVFVSGNRYTK